MKIVSAFGVLRKMFLALVGDLGYKGNLILAGVEDEG